MMISEVVEYMKFRDFILPMIILGAVVVISLIGFIISCICDWWENRGEDK